MTQSNKLWMATLLLATLGAGISACGPQDDAAVDQPAAPAATARSAAAKPAQPKPQAGAKRVAQAQGQLRRV